MFNSTMPTADEKMVSNELFSAAVGEQGTVLGVHMRFMLCGVMLTADAGALYYANNPLQGVVHGCTTKCKATITAPALLVEKCTARQMNVDYNINLAPASRNISIAPPLAQELFFLAAALVVDDPMESIDLVVGYSTTEKCTGELNYTACTLVSAIGEYNATIEAGKVYLDAPGTPHIVKASSNAPVAQIVDKTAGSFPSTLGGIVNVFFVRWATLMAA